MGHQTEIAHDDAERELLSGAIGGDVEAFTRLYECYLDVIYRYIYFRIGNEAEAEDLTEEVFIRAWQALSDYTIRQDASFSAWLYRIAHNLTVDHFRKRQPLSLSYDQMALNPAPSIPMEEAISRRGEAERLAEAVRQLNDVEQQVIVLRFVEGLAHRDVADAIGKSEGAVRVIQHRALLALRTLLER